MFGLLLASLMSVFSAFTDVSRKKVLDDGHRAPLVSFWCKAFALAAYLVGIAVLAVGGTGVGLPDVGRGLGLSPLPAFVLYVAFGALLEGTAILLTFRALQVSPISLSMPFMALTPVFLLPAGYFVLGEQVSAGMVVGVLLVATGSTLVYRKLFAKGLLEPVRAVFRERGSRYMIAVALLLTFTNLLDKLFLTGGSPGETFAAGLGRSFALAAGKTTMLLGLFAIIAAFAKSDGDGGGGGGWTAVFGRRSGTAWLVGAGLLEAVVLVLQLTALQFAASSIVISIKRAGIVLSVPLGRWFFGERELVDRAIGAGAMLAGVIIFFVTKPGADGTALVGTFGLAVAVAVVAATLAAALALTRNARPEAAA